MFTSNIEEILLKSRLENSSYLDNTIKTDNSFIDKLLSSKETNKLSNEDITYENISKISLDDIDKLFDTQEDKLKARNLKLATMFSSDNSFSKALYNTVLGKPFDAGYNYLFNMYEDKSLYLNSSKNNSLSSLLESVVSNRYDSSEKKITDKIPQSKLNEILTTVNSFSFLDAMSTGYKDNYTNSFNKDEEYSFLYNDYYLKYQELLYKYNDAKNNDYAMLNSLRQ